MKKLEINFQAGTGTRERCRILFAAVIQKGKETLNGITLTSQEVVLSNGTSVSFDDASEAQLLDAKRIDVYYTDDDEITPHEMPDHFYGLNRDV